MPPSALQVFTGFICVFLSICSVDNAGLGISDISNQVFVFQECSLGLEKKIKNFIFFLLKLIFSFESLLSEQTSLLLQLWIVNVDQTLQHVSLKQLRAHLEVDNFQELLQVFFVLDTLCPEVELEGGVDSHLIGTNLHLQLFLLFRNTNQSDKHPQSLVYLVFNKLLQLGWEVFVEIVNEEDVPFVEGQLTLPDQGGVVEVDCDDGGAALCLVDPGVGQIVRVLEQNPLLTFLHDQTVLLVVIEGREGVRSQVGSLYYWLKHFCRPTVQYE